MSPTFAEITVGIIAAALVFAFSVRIAPLIIDLLAQFMNRSLDQSQNPKEERKQDHHDR